MEDKSGDKGRNDLWINRVWKTASCLCTHCTQPSAGLMPPERIY